MRYMWINSLSIIYNDMQNRAIESLVIEKVYRNAACNISADCVFGSQSLKGSSGTTGRKTLDLRS